MGKLAGVGDVTFDCKTATIRMKGEATLDKAAVEKALTGAGCKIGEFTARERPSFAVEGRPLARSLPSRSSP